MSKGSVSTADTFAVVSVSMWEDACERVIQGPCKGPKLIILLLQILNCTNRSSGSDAKEPARRCRMWIEPRSRLSDRHRRRESGEGLSRCRLTGNSEGLTAVQWRHTGGEGSYLCVCTSIPDSCSSGSIAERNEDIWPKGSYASLRQSPWWKTRLRTGRLTN